MIEKLVKKIQQNALLLVNPSSVTQLVLNLEMIKDFIPQRNLFILVEYIKKNVLEHIIDYLSLDKISDLSEFLVVTGQTDKNFYQTLRTRFLESYDFQHKKIKGKKMIQTLENFIFLDFSNTYKNQLSKRVKMEKQLLFFFKNIFDL